MKKVTIYNVLGITAIILITLPVVLVIILSFNDNNYLGLDFNGPSLKWYSNFLRTPQWYESFITSVIIAFFSALLSILLGFFTLYIPRINRIFSLILFITFLLPLVIPPIIFGVSFLFMYSSIGLTDTYIGLIIAHSLIGFPFSFLIINNGYRNMDANLIIVAKSSGATNIFTTLKVIIPSLKKSLIVSYFFSFLISFDEPVIALFLSNSKVRTLPRQIFDGLRYDIDPTISAVSTMLIFISLIFLRIITFQTKRK
ncbi:ABC transporter permease [uncultured Draconibacterium sp.]|uniref:ABC transporter permease n=1 Tax=uncultured Draconibacterium sp. TaxID=1573823 RepID=UPI002AA76FE5|nr:ABC transporter permease [uncultured Draconibacterium sp.]